MALTPEERRALAIEIAEAIPALRTYFSLGREDQVHVIKHLLDAQIGTDATAIIATIPGLTPDLTEAITDPLLDVIAKAIAGWLAGDG
jgi:hypothetical protein